MTLWNTGEDSDNLKEAQDKQFKVILEGNVSTETQPFIGQQEVKQTIINNINYHLRPLDIKDLKIIEKIAEMLDKRQTP